MSLLDKASLVVTPNAYKESKLYSVVPNTTLGDMDVVRATTATRVNSAGLIEVVPRNLVQYSEQFNNAAWIKSELTITANSINSPTGTLTADKIIPSAVSGQHILRVASAPMNLLAGISIATYSIYAKQGEYYNLRLGSNASASFGATFNLSNGTISNNTAVSASIQDSGNGWYRCTVRGQVGSVLDALIFDNSGNEFFAGNAVNGLFLWGAQIEEASTAKEYFPTTTRLNIPRIDYTNGSCPSLLVEPQRTNLYTYSQQLNQWSKSGVITVTENDEISPEGTQNADRAQFTLSTDLLFRSGTGLAGSNTLTVYAKAKSGTSQKFRFFGLGGGTFSSDQVATNQWQRFTFTYTSAATNTAGLSGASTGASDVLFYGFQHEIGAYPTSYIPTVASTVTRNADVISKTGISSLIGQTEGTMFSEFNMTNNDLSNDKTIFAVDDNSYYVNIIIARILSNNFLNVTFRANSVAITFVNLPMISNGNHKVAIRYGSGFASVFVDGILRDTKTWTNSFTASMSQLFIGKNRIEAPYFNDRINSVQVYKTQLTNAECIALTTL